MDKFSHTATRGRCNIKKEIIFSIVALSTTGITLCCPEIRYSFSDDGRYESFSDHKIYEFPFIPMGVLGPGFVHARPSARPTIDMSENFPA